MHQIDDTSCSCGHGCPDEVGNQPATLDNFLNIEYNVAAIVFNVGSIWVSTFHVKGFQ